MPDSDTTIQSEKEAKLQSIRDRVNEALPGVEILAVEEGAPGKASRSHTAGPRYRSARSGQDGDRPRSAPPSPAEILDVLRRGLADRHPGAFRGAPESRDSVDDGGEAEPDVHFVRVRYGGDRPATTRSSREKTVTVIGSRMIVPD